MSKEKTTNPPRTLCCNALIKYVDVKGDGTKGSSGNALFLYCSHCLTLMDGNGFKLISSNEKIA